MAMYVTGSAAMAGLRPDSDIDIVLVTERSLTRADRLSLLGFLLGVSNSGTVGEPGRPLEVTSVVVSDVATWTYPPMCDFLYGEWLRDRFESGHTPERHANPDLAVLLTALHRNSCIVRGPAPTVLIDRVPAADLSRAMLAGLPSLLDDLVGDERNVLLTLARMLVTITTNDIVAKDEAARRIESDLPEPHRSTLSHAADGYVGGLHEDWSGCAAQVRATAEYLATKIRRTDPG
jgi:predicted nucleotidyltransferase